MTEEKRPVVALMYDFDKTLSPEDMQNYGFIPGVGMEPKDFWALCTKTIKDNQMDMILGYMMVMLKEAEGKMLLTREVFRAMGKKVRLFPGVSTWFQRINEFGNSRGLGVEHYIISSGLKEIIEGTPIAGEFKRVYAAEFVYNQRGVPVWPAMAVNYTSKTQFLFRINKGELDVTDNQGINEFILEEQRRIPFRNMIYLGDGITDIPCMRIVRNGGGQSIAVYEKDPQLGLRMKEQGRVNHVLPADYGKGKALEKVVTDVLEQISMKEFK
jgi:2-hydroxy-3-keto-5-methylthiopentenyl-1-phosphate phosphatase